MPKFAGRVALCLAAVAVSAAAWAAEGRMIVAMGMKGAMEDIAPRFERATGHKLIVVLLPPGAAIQRARSGEPFDALVLPNEAMKSFMGANTALEAPVVLARSSMGFAVRKGAAIPDVSTPAAVKATLLAARAIVHSDPASGGAAGLSAARLYERLGIGDEMKSKIVYPRVHSAVGIAREIADGRADLAINQMHELVQPGLEIAGPFPGDLREEVSFQAVLLARGPGSEAIRALVDYLRAPEGLEILRAHGLVPGAP